MRKTTGFFSPLRNIDAVCGQVCSGTPKKFFTKMTAPDCEDSGQQTVAFVIDGARLFFFFWMSWKEKHSSRSGLFFHSLRTVESDIQLPLLWTQSQRADGNKMWNVVCSSLGGRKNIKVFEDHQIEIRAVPQCDWESAGLYKLLKVSQECQRWRMDREREKVLENWWPENIQMGLKILMLLILVVFQFNETLFLW